MQLTLQEEVLAFSSILGTMGGGDRRNPVLGIPSLQSSSVRLSERDGAEEKKRFPRRNTRWKRPERSWRGSSTSGRPFQIPAKGIWMKPLPGLQPVI